MQRSVQNNPVIFLWQVPYSSLAHIMQSSVQYVHGQFISDQFWTSRSCTNLHNVSGGVLPLIYAKFRAVLAFVDNLLVNTYQMDLKMHKI